jgi:predicted alpha/beta-hydrolase family hydrolase
MTIPAGMVVWPGAGADRDHRTLCALEAGCGVPVRRMDHAYRLAGRGAPGKAEVDAAGVFAAVGEAADAWGVPTSSVVIGGRSYGGRMCSLAVAGGLEVAGLVLLSYPLHPPGKPDRLRTGHFGDLDVPVLFVSGTRDPFGSPEEFASQVERIPGPVEFVWLGGAHDPRNDDAVTAAVAAWLRSPALAGR